jgi:hypothetical protein
MNSSGNLRLGVCEYDKLPEQVPFRPGSGFVDLTGQQFGRLKVLYFAGRCRDRLSVWACQCACGNYSLALTASLRNGNTRSCGCLFREGAAQRARERNTRHGRRFTPEYVVWRNMIDRCHLPTHFAYGNYGARGIQVCPAWRESFTAFFADMGERPSSRHTLDRIDNNGPYEPGNCRWATSKQQAVNRRTNRTITFQGETLTYSQWSQKTGLPKDLIRRRFLAGWSAEDCLTRPPQKPGGSHGEKLLS